jgi:hypothetical protein
MPGVLGASRTPHEKNFDQINSVVKIIALGQMGQAQLDNNRVNYKFI